MIKKRIIIISSILAFVSINCLLSNAFPKLVKNVPTNTPTDIPTVTPTAEIILQPVIELSGDSVSITFTEADVQGWIDQYQATNPDSTITNPVVVLDDGLCQLTGTFQSGFIKGDLLMTFSVTLDNESNPLVTIQTLQLGGMDLPDSIRDSFSVAINQSMSSSMTSSLEGQTIKSIIIDDHLITIITSN